MISEQELNLLVKASEEGTLTDLPDHLLTEDNFLTLAEVGRDVLTIAAEHHHLDQVKEKCPQVLSPKCLVGHIERVRCLLVDATANGYLDHIHEYIPKILTLENMLLMDFAGDTPLHFAAEDGNLDQVSNLVAPKDPKELHPDIREHPVLGPFLQQMWKAHMARQQRAVEPGGQAECAIELV